MIIDLFFATTLICHLYYILQTTPDSQPKPTFYILKQKIIRAESIYCV